MAELIVLRLIHVLGGVFWVGAGLLNFLYVAPALAAAGPGAAGSVVQTFRRRRLFVVLPTVAILTMLSGLRLMQITSNGFEAGYFRSDVGLTFALGGAAAIAAFVIGLAFAMPAQRRLGAIAQQMGSADEATRTSLQVEVGRLQRRLRVIGPLVTLLLVFAAAAMAVARYV